MASFIARSFAACLTVLAPASAKLISDEVTTKTLVLFDNWATIETHSLFF